MQLNFRHPYNTHTGALSWCDAVVGRLRTAAIALTLFGFATVTAAGTLAAQDTNVRDGGRARDGSLPRDVAREVADRWNAAGTHRVRGPFSLVVTDTLRGDLAIIDGPVSIAGVVTGDLIVINANVTMDSSGRVGGSLTVVGGDVSGRSAVSVKGDVRAWRARFRYTEVAERIEPVRESDDVARWQRWRRNHENQGAWGDVFAASSHTYNRVEGLSLLLGPRLRTRHGNTAVTVETFGIFRTGDQLSWEPANLGYKLRAEVRQGRTFGFVAGTRLYEDVAPVEHWGLSDDEVGLASVLFTRDYRDYYQRHGGDGYFGLFGPARSSLTASLGEERWGSRVERNPWSVFNSGDRWRTNPVADNGVVHLITITGQLDTRNDINRPRSGWLLNAEYERGRGTLTSIAPTTVNTRTTLPGDITYARALFDFRRYNRLAPNTQLNVRIVAGGVLAGDPLPAQRRFSVSGAGAVPGYDFRSKTGVTDVGSCASGSDSIFTSLGRPAQCDRILLLQAEWRSDFHLSLGGDRDGNRRGFWRARADGDWVVFMNSGRGWLVGEGDNALHYGKASLPPFRTWRADIGGGLDFGILGVYVAQSLSDTNLKPNVFIRLGRRF